MFTKILMVVAFPLAYVALQYANRPLTQAEVLQYNAAYKQIIQAERQRVQELQRQLREEDD